MANKPLKTIKFPGLPDTYTVPQVDSTPTQGSTNAVSSGGVKSALDAVTAQIPAIDPTLSQSGQAADAKKTGDEITNLKEDLSKEETTDIPCSFSAMSDKASLSLSNYSGKKVFVSNKNLLPQFTQMTDHGVSCIKNADGSISLSGTANGVAVITIAINEMPNLGAGTYALSCGNSVAFGDNNTYINVGIDGTYVSIYARFNSVDGKTTFTVPEGSRVTEIRIRIPTGVSVPEGFKCYPQITEGSEFLDFVPHEGTILSPTSAQIDNVTIYPEYTYICAQAGVTGTVTYDASVIDDIEARVDDLDAVTAQIPAIDPTLSQSGQAADAKKTGDEITNLKEDLNKKETTDIPCSFSAMSDKASLSLSDYSGKKVFVSNKNLLPQFTQMTDHGVSCVKNADGSISLSGTANGAASIPITVNEMPNLGAGTYALSCGNSIAFGDNDTYINVGIDGSYAAIYARFNSVDGKTTFTVPEGSRLTDIRIRIPTGVSVPEGFKCYPQITEGSEFLDFVPHEGTVLSPTSAQIDNVTIYPEYTYICAQAGVTGTVTYNASVIDDIEARVTVLEGKVGGKFTGKKIVCFGDSITGNFPAPTDYPSMIAEITGATVYNAGFGGCCMCDSGDTADQPRRLFTMCRLVDSIVAGDFAAQRNSGVSITYAGTSINYVPERLDMLDGIDWSDIDYITIAYGTNDWNSNYALDNQNDPLDTTSYLGAFRYSVEKLLTAYPNIKIFVLTPLWRWWDTNTGMPSEIHSDYIDSNDYAKGTGYKLWEYGDALAEAAKWCHIPVFNLYWNCMMTKQNRFEYFDTNDGTHPKLEGRELIAEMISAQMESIY